MAGFTFTIEDTDDGGVSVLLQGDELAGGVSPACIVAMAIDNLLKSILGPKFKIEDVPAGNPSEPAA